MSTIPITIVDDFLPNPELWIDLANKCTYSKAPLGNWPGERSEPLENIHPESFNLLCGKFFSLFYNLELEPTQWKVTARFQKIKSIEGEGWVHYDKNLISGIVYLSPNSNPNAGTALYKPKSLSGLAYTDRKVEAIQSNNLNLYKDYRDLNNANFIETIKVSNIYNRLLAFDCNIAHRALEFYNNGNDRLTLVFFVEKLMSENTPIARSKRIVNV